MPENVKIKANTIFDTSEGVVLAHLRKFLQGVLEYGKSEWQRNSRKDTGTFIKSIKYRTMARAGRITGTIFSDAPETLQQVMEYGRRPGAPMPPQGALLGWMARHGIDAKAEFPIRRAISRRGIAGTYAAARAFRKIEGLTKPAGIRLQLTKALNG